jgi:UDP-3-O-[3-hydroxymyristoyl] glucosamine N-acyltransferase
MGTQEFTLAELAELTEATLIGDPEHRISGVDALESASSKDASFLANPRYRSAMQKSQAGVICIDPHSPLDKGKNYLISEEPSRTFQAITTHILFSQHHETGFKQIHPTAVIHPTAIIGSNVHIGPYTVIDQGCHVGDNTKICAHVSIGPGVTVGTECLFYPHVTIRERCIIGNRVILQPGAVIGSCGFGYVTDSTGKHTKLDQLGIVIIEDDVEIGANTTIDRARFKQTRICSGTKIDNLVQIGHNVLLGKDNIIVSQTGIAGSVKTGRNVIMGGQAGVVGHLEIADGVMIATRGGVSKSLNHSGKYAGEPVMSLAEHNRQQVHLRKISTYVKQIESLEKRLKALEALLETQGEKAL